MYCVATEEVECIIQCTSALSQVQNLSCSDKAGMLQLLRAAAANVHMIAVEVAGFATAVQEAGARTMLNATCRSLTSTELNDLLSLVSSLITTLLYNCSPQV